MTRELERSITWPRWVRLETFGTPLVHCSLFSNLTHSDSIHFFFFLNFYPQLLSPFFVFIVFLFPFPLLPFLSVPFSFLPLTLLLPSPIHFHPLSLSPSLHLSFHFLFFQQWGYRHVAGVASCCTGSLVTILITFSMGHNHSLLLIRNKLTIRWLQ